MQFLEDVLSEVIDLFPSEYIHVGGDECPKVRWEKCPKCQARIKAEGIKGDKKHSAEEYLQSYVISRMEKFVESKGRHIIGWDEILEGGLAPNATVMSWRGMDGGIEAAKQKHNVVMTPNTRSLSALCSLRFHYTMWKRRTGNATEFATRYDEMMQMVEMLQGDKDYPYWKCFMKFFIWLSASQWQQLWDDVDAVLIQL